MDFSLILALKTTKLILGKIIFEKKKASWGRDIISNVILVGRGRGRGREWVINVQMNILVAKNPAGTLQMSLCGYVQLKPVT